jgi:hypothetical protein
MSLSIYLSDLTEAYNALLLFVIEAILHVKLCYKLGHILETKSDLFVYSIG